MDNRHHGRTTLSSALALSVVLVMAVSLGEIAPIRPGISTGERPASPLAGSIKRASSAIAITADGLTLAAANPDSNSVTLVNAATRSALAEIGVGIDPRMVAIDEGHNRLYVTSRGDDRVTLIDLASLQVVTATQTGGQPYGIVVDAAGQLLYVAEQGADRIAVLDALTLDRVAAYPTADRPSGLALSADGRTLVVTHLLTNTLTILTVRPFTAYLPLLIREGITTAVSGGTRATGTIWAANIPSTTLSLWPDSNLVQSIVIAPDGQRAYVVHTRSNTGNRALTFDTTVFPVVSLIDLPSRRHLLGQQFDLGTFDPPGVGLPFDAALTPDGAQLWVVNAGSNDVTVIDLTTRQRVAHIEVGDNPRGIAFAPDGSEAYVNATLAGTVEVLSAGTYTITAVITATEIPLPPVLLNGKRLFNSSDDPRMARAQWISCATCHFEGEHDGRTWFFGFAGPRNTTSLLGMIETYPLRWSGEWDESADSEFAVRQENFGSGLITGELYCALMPLDCVHQPPNQGRSDDLDSLAAFIDSLRIPLSPTHAHGEPLSAAETRGQASFHIPTLGCVTCHPPPLYTDLQAHDVGTATDDERIGPAYDTPSLRGLYGSAPYFHDGSAGTLHAALTRPTPNSEHDVSEKLTETETTELVEFLLALPFQP
ncbi:MAG: beta-propeller fold lactonase family protein [Anaerolineae bacterium]|nr:beta-propeller fold lactonase family protein [Anaerolineae bacterium]